MKTVKIFIIMNDDAGCQADDDKMPLLFRTYAEAQEYREALFRDYWEIWDEHQHLFCPQIDWSKYSPFVDYETGLTPEDRATLDAWEAHLKTIYGDPLPNFPPWPGYEAAQAAIGDDDNRIVEIDFEPAGLSLVKGGTGS